MARLESTGQLGKQAVNTIEAPSEPRIRPIDFSPVTDRVHRRWDPNQFLYQQVIQRFVGRWQQLLQPQCATGVHAVRFAHLGYDVHGVDRRPELLQTARQYARKYGLASRCTFQTAPPLSLPFDSGRFDVVIGMGTLTADRVLETMFEIHRVLKPGGVALLKQRLADQFLPPSPCHPHGKQKIASEQTLLSGDSVRCRDLPNRKELERVRQVFSRTEMEQYALNDRLARMRVKLPEQTLGRLSQLDGRLRQACPPLADLTHTVVLTCVK